MLHLTLQAEVRTLTHQLDEVKHELALEKRKSGLIKGPPSGGTAGKGQGLTGEGQGQMATMEMQVLNEKQRAELANAR